MPDPIDQLERYAEAVAAETIPVDIDALARPRGTWRARLVAVAAALLLIAGVAGAVTVLDDDDTSPVDMRGDPLPSTDPSGPATDHGPPTTGPATLRTSAVTVETPDEYLVWAGEAGHPDASHRADGFAVDRQSGLSSPIPPAPIDPRSAATGVWTGSEMIVCCGTGEARDTRSAAAWKPTTRQWTTLADPPSGLARAFAASVWTGDEMIVIAPGPTAASYDPASDAWTAFPAPPLQTSQPQALWTGDQIIVWDSAYGGDRGWRLTMGDDAWEPLPDLPAGHRTQLGGAVWTGSEVFVWGQSSEDEARGVGARWAPASDAWMPVASSPQRQVLDPFNGTPGSQAVAADGSTGLVLVRDLDGALRAAGETAPGPNLHQYDPATDTWQTPGLALAGFHPQFSVAGGRVFVPDEAAPMLQVDINHGGLSPGSLPDPTAVDGPHVGRDGESPADLAERVMSEVVGDPASAVSTTEHPTHTLVRLETARGTSVNATVIAHQGLRRSVLLGLRSPGLLWSDTNGGQAIVPESGWLTVTGLDGALATPGELIIHRLWVDQPGLVGSLNVPESSWIHIALETETGATLHLLQLR